MIIRRIRLVNFRNRDDYELVCKDELTSILGENGCGKTSVLEGVYEALQGRSFRAVDNEIMQRGEEFYRVEVEYYNGERVVVTYNSDGGKKFVVADKHYKRLPRKSKYPVVLFEPDDLNLVGASPARRREFFDKMLAQLDTGYASLLAKYRKVLVQRNELLKNEMVVEGDLFSWNVLLAKYGCGLRRKRQELVKEINLRLTEVYRSIAENNDVVELSYEGDELNCNEEEYLQHLEEGFRLEKIIGHTRFGAHRDSYEFWFNKVEADGSASRGEVRSIVIALKFIEAELVLVQTGKVPVVLLDDVFSELDAARQKALMMNFKNNQIILTGVG